MPKVISKLVNEEGLTDIKNLIKNSKGIFLPRGHLSTLLPIQKLA